MATFVIGDIHNSLKQLEKLLEQIAPTERDRLFFLGDLFDRGGEAPDPVGVYFTVTGLDADVTWIRGNHDQYLADYIYRYYGTAEKKRGSLPPYCYNSFDRMKERLVEADMIALADRIMCLPLQAEIKIGSVRYLLAHAMTFDPSCGEQEVSAYLEGTDRMEAYWKNGVDGYVSLVGHLASGYQRDNPNGRYLDAEGDSIWRNMRGNVYMMDCGCGLPLGRLSCMCLETEERFYS